MAGAFWYSRANFSLNVGPKITSEATISPLGGSSDSSTGISDASGTPIQVADLPNVNGQASGLMIDKSQITQDDQAMINFIHVPGPSTLSYDQLKDKSLLYPDGIAKYSDKDLKSKVATNHASLTSYGLDLIKRLSGFPFYTQDSPPEIAYGIFSGKDTQGTGPAELDAIKLAYQSASKNLLFESVPRDLTALHLKLINTLDRTAQLIGNMEETGSDQLLGLNSARQYIEEEKYALGALGEINTYLKSRNISLGNDNKLKIAIDIYK